MTDKRYAQNDWEETLRRFPGETKADDAVLSDVVRRAGTKKHRYPQIAAGVAAALVCAAVLPLFSEIRHHCRKSACNSGDFYAIL